MALQVWESQQCPNCGNYDSLVPLPAERRLVGWEQHDGRKYEVVQYRCLPCASRQIIERDWHADHEKDVATRGSFMASDGRMFIPRPTTEEA